MGVKSQTFCIVYGSAIAFLVFCMLSCIDALRRTPIAVMLAGFLGALIFFFTVVLIGHIYALKGIKEKPGWIPISVSLAAALFGCWVVHAYSFIYCCAFSAPIVTYLGKAAHVKRPKHFLKMRELKKD